MPHLARHFIKLLPIVIATAVAACALGAPSDALAGMNGQQITACPSDAVANGFFYADGPNQNGQHVTSPVYRLGTPDPWNANAGCVTVYGYWWVGAVTTHWYRSDGTRLINDYTCTVPKYNPFTNTRRCETFDY